MRLKRRKRHIQQLTDEERIKLQDASYAHEYARGLLAETRSQSLEIEVLVTWLRRARLRNNFAERVAYMLQHPREENPPWQP